MIIKKISRGQMVPPWYGVYRHDFATDYMFAMPVPFHLLAAAIDWVWSNLRWLHKGVYISPRQAYNQGYADAKKETNDDARR